MKRYVLFLVVAAVIAGCSNDNKVTIKGAFSEGREGMIYLDKSDVDRSIVIDSTRLKNSRFNFSIEI